MGFWKKLFKGVKEFLTPEPTPKAKPSTAKETEPRLPPDEPDIDERLPPVRPFTEGNDVGNRWRNIRDNLYTAAENAGTDIPDWKLERSKELFNVWGQPGHFNNEERKNAFEEYQDIWEDELIYEDTLAAMWTEWRAEKYGVAA